MTTNWPAGRTTNYMYLTDNFGERTNLQAAVNGRVNPQSGNSPPTYKPVNYNFTIGSAYSTSLPAATVGLPPGTFDSTYLTNQFTAYDAIFTSPAS